MFGTRAVTQSCLGTCRLRVRRRKQRKSAHTLGLPMDVLRDGGINPKIRLF